MIILTDTNNTIIDIVDSAETVSNGLQVSKAGQVYIYGSNIILQQHEATVPEEIVAQKYKYVNGEFVKNPVYIEADITH